MTKPSIFGAIPNPSIILPTGKATLPMKAGQANAFKAKAGEHYGNLKKKDAEEQLTDDVVARPSGEDAKQVDAGGIRLTLESTLIQALVEVNEVVIETAMPGQLAQGYQPSAQGAAGALLNEGTNLGGQVFAYAGADALLLAQAETGVKAGAAASAAVTPDVATADIDPLVVLGIVGLGVGVAAAAGRSSAPYSPAPAVDTTAPTLSITSSVAAVKTGETATITFTFSEATSNFVVGDITTSSGSLSNFTAVSSTVYTATFTPSASLASGSASITVASGAYTDAAGNAGGAGATPTISIDTVAPTVTNTIAAYTASTDTLVLTGVNYNTLLETSEGATSDIKARLDWSKLSWDINGDNASTANVSFAEVDISSAKVTDSTHLTIVLTSAKGTSLEATNSYGASGTGGVTLDTLDITAGFAKDAAGNAATTDAQANAPLFTNAGQSVIDLDSYGKLTFPVQVEGAWYYFWDRNGNGISQGTDFAAHDELDGIFTSTLSEVNAGTTGTGTDTTDLIRYANLNGVKLALPTANGGVAYPQGINDGQNGTSYTDAGGSTNGTTSAFNELLAIWDAYNGTGTDNLVEGVPPGWKDDEYLSATPSASGRHAKVYLSMGIVEDWRDEIHKSVALQVL